MESNELRIGNWYSSGIDIETGHPLYHQVTADLYMNWHVNGCWAEPIPLTEEWLFKFKFEPKSKHSGLYLDGIWFVDKSPIKSDKYCFGELMQGTYCEIEYVHQLQNLYFALMGEELSVL